MLLKLVLTFTVNEGAFISPPPPPQTMVPFCDTNRSILAYIYLEVYSSESYKGQITQICLVSLYFLIEFC